MQHTHPESLQTLNRIRIVESGEPLVDLRRYPIRLEPNLEYPFLRRTVAEMLATATAYLPSGYQIVVTRAFRTLAMQAAHWDEYCAQLRKAHPHWPKCTLHRETNRRFAPCNQPTPPGHCTGGAIDAILVCPDGNTCDLHTSSTAPPACADILRTAMVAVGFSPYRYEPWHFSYGDSAWAARNGLLSCPYGLVEAPK